MSTLGGVAPRWTGKSRGPAGGARCHLCGAPSAVVKKLNECPLSKLLSNTPKIRTLH